MTNRYEQRIHIGCGGDLSYEVTKTYWKILNARALGVKFMYDNEDELIRVENMLKKWGQTPIIKSVTKNLYRCDKCNELVNVITCPSWEQFVLDRRIKVPFYVFRKIEAERKAGALRY